MNEIFAAPIEVRVEFRKEILHVIQVLKVWGKHRKRCGRHISAKEMKLEQTSRQIQSHLLRPGGSSKAAYAEVVKVRQASDDCSSPRPCTFLLMPKITNQSWSGFGETMGLK